MSADRLFELASSYHREGRLDLAEGHYREVLAGDPDHWAACYGLAQLLIRLDRFNEAIACLTPLLNREGDTAAVCRQLGLAEACAGRRLRSLRHFERALEYAPDDATTAHLVANLQQALGMDEAAQASYRRALKLRPLILIPAAVAPPDFRALFVFAPGAGNTPIEYLVANARFESNVITVLADMDYDYDRLRGYADVVVNLVSDVDRGLASLGPAEAFIAAIGSPVINPPRLIVETSRESVARRLEPVPGCRVPQTRLHPAAQLQALAAQGGEVPPFPLLVRPAGSHGGEAFEKVGDLAQLQAFLAKHVAENYYLTPFVNYRSADGYFRKYRFVFVDDEILPYHLAIDDKWKVHHVTTGMGDSAWMQAEEQAFLDDPWRVFGAAQREALRAIRNAIGLDYFGIDCSLGQDGAIVVFEVNASMLVHGNNQQFPYKTEAVERIKRAFHTMLAKRVAACQVQRER
ncbi:tetratricopeptide repeat protein [Paraburkholderia acidipaludis]|uniref:tetratricopeptide repeat protein n=1 Tax=Paraburkholderia acidipaludis TaxID=660537 RepID=UPI000480C3CD|nr:tetratricopeptide repeat protein [Paraburkholderia acidipaludis]